MRAKVVLSASVLALAILAPAIYFHYKPSQLAPAPAPVQTVSDDSTNVSPSGLPSVLKRASAGAQDQGQGVAIQDSNGDDATPLSHDDYVIKRKSELYELGMSQDPASLKVILSEMHNSDPDIRAAALSAVMDFDSPDAIPALQNEMAWAEDPEEKVAIKRAIEFLQLPPFGSGDAVTQQSDGQSPPATN